MIPGSASEFRINPKHSKYLNLLPPCGFHLSLRSFASLQGTVSVISSDPPCKDVNAEFTTVPLRPSVDQ